MASASTVGAGYADAMSLALAAILAAAPVSFDALVRDAEIIGVATVVRSDWGADSSTLEFDQLFRGKPASAAVEAKRAFPIGERGVFFVGSKIEPTWLAFQPRFPGVVRFSANRVIAPRLSAEPEGEYMRSIPYDRLLEAIGVRGRTIQAPPHGFRVISRSCKRCSLEAEAEALISALEKPVTCPTDPIEACVRTVWKMGRPVVTKRRWTGVDSSGSEFLLGTSASAVTLRFDSSVTGNGTQCSAAVFATKCRSVTWSKGSPTCSGESSSVCNEWKNRLEELGELQPLSDLKCGSRDQCDVDAGTYLCMTDEGFLNCRAR